MHSLQEKRGNETGRNAQTQQWTKSYEQQLNTLQSKTVSHTKPNGYGQNNGTVRQTRTTTSRRRNRAQDGGKPAENNDKQKQSAYNQTKEERRQIMRQRQKPQADHFNKTSDERVRHQNGQKFMNDKDDSLLKATKLQATSQTAQPWTKNYEQHTFCHRRDGTRMERQSQNRHPQSKPNDYGGIDATQLRQQRNCT